MSANLTKALATTDASGRSKNALATLVRDPGIVRVLRWLSTVMLVLVLMLGMAVTLGAAAPLKDPDTWWHLLMGHKFLEGASIKHPGPMSYFGTEDWQSRDWLVQIVAATFDDWFGLPGVAWLYGLGLVSFYLALYRLCRERASFAAAAIGTPIALLASWGSLTARPQLASFILLAITVGAVLRMADDLRPRWWLPLLTGLWACVHGMWFLSPLLQCAVLAGLLLDRRLDGRSARRFLAVLVLSVLAVAVTPNGPSLLRHPLGVATVEIFQYISETQPPSARAMYYALTLAMLGVTVVTWARRSSTDWVRILLLAVSAVFAVQMARTVAVGAIIVTPLFAQALDYWLAAAPVRIPRAVERVVVYGGAFLALSVVAVVAPKTASEPGSEYAIAFATEIEEIPRSAVVLNELGDGGFLSWRYPGLRITVDGLTDQYSMDYLADALAAGRLEPGWEDFVRRTGADYALLDTDSPLAAALELSGWTVTAEDENRVLLEK